ncbi:MAG: EAL domain-containing protein [Ruminococcus sp.]|nr:EAL domain-containing protein [Ruminococcus sp.]
MILFFIICLYFTAGLILFGYYFSLRRSYDIVIAHPVRRVMIASAAAVACYATAIFIKNETVALIISGAYFFFIDVTLISLMVFIKRYTGMLKNLRKEASVLSIAAVIDGIFLIANVFTDTEFELRTIHDGLGLSFNIIKERGILGKFHILIVYGSLLIIIIDLLKKISRSPKIYKVKYASILITLCITIVIHCIYRRASLNFDYSLVCYALLSYVILYFSIVYIPRGLMDRLLYFTVANMKDGIICIDIDGRCIHYNKPAMLYCDAVTDKNNIETQVNKWLGEQLKDSYDYREWESVRRIEGVEHHYEIEFQRIFDSQMKYLGSFFLIRDMTDEFQRFSSEQFRATHDALTGIYNKDHFFESAKERISGNPDTDYCIITTDIKNFKIINDIFGVEKGDALLKQIAATVEKAAGSNACYGRLSGDRFAICMPENEFSETEILSRFEALSSFLNNSSFKVFVHIGVYKVSDRDLRVSVMVDRANLAIRRIKDNYRNSVSYFDDSLRANTIREQMVISEFDSAIAKGEFQVYIQPQVCSDGVIYGGEALVRWIHPREGQIPPSAFIKIFEKTGLISKMDQYVWEQACVYLRYLNDHGVKNTYISVNISKKDFFLLDVYEIFTSLISKYRLDPHSLHLEITETAIMNSPEKQLPLVNKLRNFGFIVEIDDFGSGTSSLNSLKDINADVLKIDMGFLQKTNNPERGRTILRTIIDLAKSLDMKVITEGVEHPDQVEFLSACGCDVYQGYYFSKPTTFSDFAANYLNKSINTVNI